MFDKCPSCGAVVPKTELSHSLYVCTKCGYHHTIGAYLRLAMLLDSKSFRELDQDLVAPMCWVSPDMRRSWSASGIRLA